MRIKCGYSFSHRWSTDGFYPHRTKMRIATARSSGAVRSICCSINGSNHSMSALHQQSVPRSKIRSGKDVTVELSFQHYREYVLEANKYEVLAGTILHCLHTIMITARPQYCMTFISRSTPSALATVAGPSMLSLMCPPESA